MLVTLLAVVLGQAPVPPLTPTEVESVSEGLRLVTHVNGLPVELSRLPLGPVVDVLRHGDALYAALAAGGVAVVDIHAPTAPVVVTRLAEGRHVERLAHQGAETLVLLCGDRDALGFSLFDPLHPQPAEIGAPVSPAAAPVGTGKVLAVEDGTLVIEGGTNLGLRVGGNVRLRARDERTPEDALAQAAGMKAEGRQKAVLELERVEAERSLAHLGRGDSAAVGDVVEVTNEATSGSTFFPRARTFHWRLLGGLRTFLDTAQSSNAVGMLLDLDAAYYFDAVPLRLEAGLRPLGFAIGSSQAHNPVAAVATAAYSTTFFELGLGSGISALAGSSILSPCPSTGCPSSAGTSALIVNTFRLGAIDGLSFDWLAAVGTFRSGFSVMSARAEINVPILAHLSVFGAGGGGVGYSVGEFGARTYLNGVGGPGTFILSASLLGASISDNFTTLSGPGLGLSIELRL